MEKMVFVWRRCFSLLCVSVSVKWTKKNDSQRSSTGDKLTTYLGRILAPGWCITNWLETWAGKPKANKFVPVHDCAYVDTPSTRNGNTWYTLLFNALFVGTVIAMILCTLGRETL